MQMILWYYGTLRTTLANLVPWNYSTTYTTTVVVVIVALYMVPIIYVGGADGPGPGLLTPAGGTNKPGGPSL